MELLDSILPAISAYFDAHQRCTEHELISHLQKRKIEPFDQLNLRHSKDLFCAHFLTRHALYQLQNHYQENASYCLKIELTQIERLSYLSGSYHITPHDALKAYYLDISHYFETGEDEINELLTHFWQKYLAQDDKLQALQVLGLPANADYAAIKKHYRSLAQKNHPDKGGCAEQFAKISAAKTILDTVFR